MQKVLAEDLAWMTNFYLINFYLLILSNLAGKLECLPEKTVTIATDVFDVRFRFKIFVNIFFIFQITPSDSG